MLFRDECNVGRAAPSQWDAEGPLKQGPPSTSPVKAHHGRQHQLHHRDHLRLANDMTSPRENTLFAAALSGDIGLLQRLLPVAGDVTSFGAAADVTLLCNAAATPPGA